MVKPNYNDYIKKVKTYIFTYKKILILNTVLPAGLEVPPTRTQVG